MPKPHRNEPDDQAAQADQTTDESQEQVTDASADQRSDSHTQARSDGEDATQLADSQAESADTPAPTEADELRNQLLRTRADFDNYKRRAAEDQARLVSVARAGVILELLPVIDNFERAFKTVPKEIEQDPWYGGVAAITQQFESVLRSLNIERIKTVGEHFDPNLHEAIATEPSDKHDENVISEEFEAGYQLGDEVIRHAKVKVSSGKNSTNGKTSTK